MCWTITKDAIVQREVVTAERVQAPPTTEGYKKAPTQRPGQLFRIHQRWQMERLHSATTSRGKLKNSKPDACQ
jgi:hypothetical protein